MSEPSTVDVYRCGGCERVYSDDQAVTCREDAPGQWVEFHPPLCPFCGTEQDDEKTQQRTVVFDSR